MTDAAGTYSRRFKRGYRRARSPERAVTPINHPKVSSHMKTIDEIQTEARRAFLTALEKMKDAEQEAADFWFTKQFEQYHLVRERQIDLAKTMVFALGIEKDVNPFKDRGEMSEGNRSFGPCEGDVPF